MPVNINLNNVQPTLQSGTNIKTVNTNSLLGSGDISVGTVTSVAALTVGTTGTDLSSTVATGTTTPVITLNVPTASATNRGALSSADWTTFNNKVSTGAITTSGLTMDTSRLLGRTTAANGAVEQISIGTGLTLTGGTLSATGGGITVGTTTVTSGTDTRVFFQQGGVVQQDANFTFNNTQKRLTLRASGTAATDIPFLVRNSADTINLVSVNGLGRTRFSFDSTGTDFIAIEPQLSEIAMVAYGGLKMMSLTNSQSFFGFGVAAYRMGIGTNSPQARLDVRAQGALSTDIAFRVRNSADTDNLIESAGNGLIKFRTGTERIEINTSASDYKMSAYKFGIEMSRISTYLSYFCYGGTGQYFAIGKNTASYLFDVGQDGGQHAVLARFDNDNNAGTGSTIDSSIGIDFTTRYSRTVQTGRMVVGNVGNTLNGNAKSYFKFHLARNGTLAERASITSQSNLLLQSPTEDTNDVGVIYIPNGTAPTTNATDAFKLYSADIVAGNAAPHFRTENGSIIKLFQGAALTASDGTLANAVTRIGELEARLKAHGLIA